MTTSTERARTREARIERLRRRLGHASADPELVAILKGILDLLADEL